MSRENIKALLPILTAYADGATVQVNTSIGAREKWEDAPNPSFSLDPKLYRIKPTPLIVHVVLNKEGRVVNNYPNIDVAKSSADSYNKKPNLYQNYPYTAHTLMEDKS